MLLLWTIFGLFSNLSKHFESLIKTQIAASNPQSWWFNSSLGEPKNFHFQQVPNVAWCCLSRTTLLYPLPHVIPLPYLHGVSPSRDGEWYKFCEDVLPAFQVAMKLLGIYILPGIDLSQLLLYTQEYKHSSSLAYSLEQLQSVTYPVSKTLPWNLIEVPIMGFWYCTYTWSISFPGLTSYSI